jgi:F0F1-type ATP synthase membrane subunit b/b'
MEKDVIQKRVWNTKQLVSIISFVVIATFYVTVVYLQIQDIEDRLDKKIKLISDNTTEINKLKVKCK